MFKIERLCHAELVDAPIKMNYYYVYILQCADGSYYRGMTNNIDRRLQQHQSGSAKFSYTTQRLPVLLKWQLQCTSPSEAIRIEKQIKGWSPKKKSALFEGRWDDLVNFSKNYTEYGKQD